MRYSNEKTADLLKYLGKGLENAKPLPVLARLLNINERLVRLMVQEINTTGQEVIIREQGKGYYIPATEEELDGYIRYNISYRNKLTKKLAGLRKYRKDHFGDNETAY